VDICKNFLGEDRGRECGRAGSGWKGASRQALHSGSMPVALTIFAHRTGIIVGKLAESQ
jgi:hypothetical protein